MYKLDALQYPYDALEPVIDQKTVEVHHGKHHQTYVNNLNKAIEGLNLKEQTIEELLKDLSQVPEERRQAVINHGGGYCTLYAHCSQLLAQVGDTVNKYDTIAKVGATGDVTGNHLHICVIIDGVYVNPKGYLH